METLRRAKNLRAFCRRRFGLEFDDDEEAGEGDEARRGRTPGSNENPFAGAIDLEEGEDAPVVVELPEGNVRADGRGGERRGRGRAGDE